MVLNGHWTAFIRMFAIYADKQSEKGNFILTFGVHQKTALNDTFLIAGINEQANSPQNSQKTRQLHAATVFQGRSAYKTKKEKVYQKSISEVIAIL